MSYASNDEIRGVLIQAGNERVLLPNATVAEMMSRVPVQPVSDAPRWLVGEIGWHGWGRCRWCRSRAFPAWARKPWAATTRSSC